MKKNKFLLFFCILLAGVIHAQNPVNAYANVTAVSGTTISVNNVNETYHSFEDGDYVVIMQMQDNVIGTTSNTSGFGSVGSILSAGLFEVCRISSHIEAGAVPTSIVLSSAPLNSYHINANASVQLITYRFLGANYTTTANIGTSAWNGTVGGVTAFFVTGTLTLNNSISADGSGFRFGPKNSPNNYNACTPNTYCTTIGQYFAGKGEGIYKASNTAYLGARGMLLNGGGGGNDVNAGGGGGGNYLSGGGGGSGWTGSTGGCSPICGGLGGLTLSSYISSSRIFMGGGGGGGHENDGHGSVGGSGGGIILIKAATLATSASCSGITISSNGVSAANTSNDGAGGGGAGGSILLQVGSYNVLSSCHLTVSANGGSGGNSNVGSTDAHGGGGGGGQGVIIYSTAQPTTNIATNTTPGTGGTSCSGCSSASNGSTGSGTTNSGIVPNGGSSGPLPVELLSFNAVINDQNDVLVSWRTAVEKNSDHFVLQRMSDDGAISDISTIKCNGNYSSYYYVDLDAVSGNNYYRLKQVDNDGTSHFRNWINVQLQKKPATLSLYPNPVGPSQALTLECTNYHNLPVQFDMMDVLGRVKISQLIIPDSNDQKVNIGTGGLESGVYFISLVVNGIRTTAKLIITQ